MNFKAPLPSQQQYFHHQQVKQRHHRYTPYRRLDEPSLVDFGKFHNKPQHSRRPFNYQPYQAPLIQVIPKNGLPFLPTYACNNSPATRNTNCAHPRTPAGVGYQPLPAFFPHTSIICKSEDSQLDLDYWQPKLTAEYGESFDEFGTMQDQVRANNFQLNSPLSTA